MKTTARIRSHWSTRVLGAALLVAAVGCQRASEDDCRRAVQNIFAITGVIARAGAGPDEHAAIRSCRANASRAAVVCMIAAQTAADLAACEGETAESLAPAGATAPKPGQ